MGRFLIPIAVFYSDDHGEWWVAPKGHGAKYRVYGPWTCDVLASFTDRNKAIEHARMLAGVKFE